MGRKKKDINILIGKRLQDVRENNGYTQEQFAEILCVGVEHYRKLESGMYGLDSEKMLILYKSFSIDPAYLITGDRNQASSIDLFIANCSREERNQFVERIMAYAMNIIKGSK